jgi:hypothetical protein
VVLERDAAFGVEENNLGQIDVERPSLPRPNGGAGGQAGHNFLEAGDTGRHRHCFNLIVSDIDDRRPQPLVKLLDFGAHVDAELGVEI